MTPEQIEYVREWAAMTNDEWLRTSAEAMSYFAPRIFAQFRQGLSMAELAQAHGVSAATIEALIRQAMVDSENAKKTQAPRSKRGSLGL